jgi:L-lactate utilization protein LutC
MPSKPEKIRIEDPVVPSEPIEREPSKQSDSESLVRKFTDELIALGGTVTMCTQSDLPQMVYEALQNEGMNSLIAWDDDQLPDGLIAYLSAKGIEIRAGLDPNVKAGLSGASGGIAATGTLILPSGRGKGQYVSFLPEVHYAVLRASDIFADLTQVLKFKEMQDASVVTLISGPSRTADIEMTLTIGVHGPRKLSVFCLTGD